jgi:hypothetical protein
MATANQRGCTVILLGGALVVFGNWSVNRPSRQSAVTRPASTALGNWIERRKVPLDDLIEHHYYKTKSK